MKTRRYYIGCAKDVQKRLKTHNNGGNVSTKLDRPWSIVWYKSFGDKKDAYELEKKIKSYKGGNAFKKLVIGDVA